MHAYMDKSYGRTKDVSSILCAASLVLYSVYYLFIVSNTRLAVFAAYSVVR